MRTATLPLAEPDHAIRGATARRRRGIDPLELAVLAALAAVSLWVVGVDLFEVVARGRHWLGTDGLFYIDQLQYLAWIQSASQHGLAANLFVLAHTPADYFQPLISISGGLVALGVAPWVALLLWKPVAVGAIFLATRALIHRTIPGPSARRVALILALFAGVPVTFPDLWLAFWTWGYPFGLISLAAATTALIVYERARATGGRGVWLAALLAALASSLHPWQGEVLMLILLGSEALMWRPGDRAPAARLGVVLAATALPLVYYLALARFDAGWRLAEQASRGAFALTRLARDLGPLALPALLAYRRPVTTFTAAAVRVWPPAALAVFLATQHGVGSGGMHAFVGVTVPLAILAVDGVGRLGRVPRALRLILVAVAVGALTVPVMVDRIRATRPFLLPSGAGANLVTSTNRQVLHYLKRSPQAGGVLAIWTFGPLVPAETGRRVYVGDIFWSRPDLRGRVARSDALVNQTMSAPQARAFVLSTGARFVVDPYCRHAKLTAQLAPITAGVARFGCTAVYTIKRPAG